MNKNCYRVIFSRVLQRRVVVAESARIAHGQASAATESPATLASTTGTFCGLMPALCAGVRLALGLLVVVGPAQADIVADALAPATQRPIVLNTANGLPQVNIQTPSAAGVSRNSYSQFDVGSQGVILNNSRVDVQTQLGGWVTANPWLARGPARVILNEVNSDSPSLLQGYIEVAGQRAQVVVANPTGISCNGCGFINASRSTLTTGSPVLNNGNLEAFVVQRGTISIEGLGMDATRSDYSDVIARAVQLNAGLWTPRLNIVTGAAQVEAATGDAAPAVLGLATAAGAAPRYAVDVSALGGMYAGKIHLVGTEAGVGVANAGTIGASAGDVLVDIHGQLSNSGRINASTALNITTQQGVDNSGMLYAQQSLSVVAAGDVDNRHIMAAGQDVSLRSDGRIDSAPGSLLAAGLDTEGRLHDNGTLSLQATRDISLHGQVLAGSALTLQAANIDLAGSQAQAADMRFTTPGNLNLDRATVQASRQLALSAGQTLQTTAAILSAPRQLLEAHDVDNSGGLISSAGDISLSASALNNSGGIIQAQGNQSLMLGSGVIDNRDSLLYAGATLAITAGTLLNNNTLGDARGLQGRTLNLQLDTLDNTQGALRASDKLSVTSHGDINNSAGLMSAQGDLLLQDSDPGQRALQMLNTDGTVIADRSLALAMASLSGDGKLLSPGRIAISLDQDFTNSRLVQAGTDLQLGSKGLVSNQGQLLSTGNLTLQATRVDNSAGAEINAAILRLNVSDTLINRGLIDGGDVRLVIGNMLSNRGTGRIYGDHLALQAGTLLNTDEVLNGVSTAAVIAARDRLDIGVVLLRNEHDALIFSGGAMAIGGALDSNGMTIGQAGEVDNIGSQIEASTALSLAAATLNNRNADFQTEIAPVGTPQTLFALDPADDGNNNQYDIGNFERYSWSRTYKYRWKTAAAETAVAPEPGKTPLPQVGETEDCAADPCALLPMADYAAGNAAWSYFQIAPPAPEPAAPVMAEPVPPAGLETDPAYAAAWQTYHEDKAVYDSAWANYNTTHASWQAATDTAYATLDNKIEAYNAQFSSSGNFNKWTEYHLTQTETETRVTRSDPARLLAGGDMVLRGDHLVNDKSQIIAGGLLSGDLGALDNIEAEGVHVVHKEGTSQYTDTRWRGGTRRYYQRTWYPEAPYQPADQVSTITLPVTMLQANTQPAGSGATLPANAQSALPAGAGGLVAPATPTVDIRITLPNSALFLITPPANSHVLVETDPRFANYRQWLSSDYLLNALSFDPARTQKRLGDGFYEQKLVREQIAQLTGLRFLEGYASDEEQYRALMDNAVTFARAYGLRPGLALTPAQMAALTSDIVWLVEETVTLPDGSQQKVLAPRVYVKTRIGDLKGDGTLIAAQDMDIRLQGTLANSGTMAGRQVMKITADTIHNLGGRLDAGTLSLAARNDLDNQGGLLTAKDSAYITAGHDLTMASTTQTTANSVGDSSFSRTALDRLAGLYVSKPGGTLTLAAGHDLTLTAAQVVNAGSGGTMLAAGNKLTLDTVNVGEQNNSVANADNYNRQGHAQDMGSQVSSQGSLSLSGKNIAAEAAKIGSQQGSVLVQADDSLVIKEGRATTNSDIANKHTDKRLLQSATYSVRDAYDSDEAVGSSLDGKTVTLQGRDVKVQGSAVISDEGTFILGSNSVAITNAENHYSELHEQETKKSGILSGGAGLISGAALLKEPLVIGKSKTETRQSQESTTSAGSTVGAIQGNVVIQSGGTYTQIGSSVIAGTGVDAEGRPRLLAKDDVTAGNVVIAAKRVAITDAQESVDATQSSKSKTTALTVSMNSPVLDAAKGMQAQHQAARDTDSSRMKALSAANVVMQGGSALTAMGMGSPGGVSAANAASVSVLATVGVQKSQSHSEQHSQSSAGSQLAGNNVFISATGGGAGSDIVIQGSDVRAAHIASLKADDAIQVTAGKNTATQTGKSSSAGGGIGVGANLGANGVGFGVAVTANGALGKENGQSTRWSNSHISAGEQLHLESGSDVDIAGAVLAAPQVTGTVGGHLDIRSLQDSTTYESKGANASGTAIIGVGGSVSGSAGMSKVDSDYLSVGEKSGIKAGDGGFQLDVAGKTTLSGAEISSTEAAVANGANRFHSAAGLELQDLYNHAEYKATGVQASASGGGGAANNSNNTAFKPNSVGFGGDDGSTSSVTTAGISGMTGDTSVRSDKDTANSLKPIFDAEKVKQEIAAQTAITAEFGRQAPKVVADYAGNQRDALQRQAQQESDPQEREELLSEAARWDEGGVYRVAAHTVLGALGGGTAAAAITTGAAAAAAAPAVDSLEVSMIDALQAAGLSEDAAYAASNGLLLAVVTAGGAATGGVAGAGMAVNVDVNNRQLHDLERKWIKSHAASYAKEYYKTDRPSVEQVAAAQLLLETAAEKMVDKGYDTSLAGESTAMKFLMNSGVAGTPIGSTGQWMFVANEAQRNDFFMNMSSSNPVQVAMDSASAKYNLALANVGFTRSNPLIPQIQGPWGEPGIRQISEDIDGKIYTGQKYGCFVASCIDSSYVNNPETNVLLRARADKAMNDMLSVGSYATGITGIGYGLVGKAAPVALGAADSLINAFQAAAAYDQNGWGGLFTSLASWGASWKVNEVSGLINLNPAIGQSLGFGFQLSIPKAVDEIVESRSDKK